MSVAETWAPRATRRSGWVGTLLIVLLPSSKADPLSISSFESDGTLTYTGGPPVGIAIIQISDTPGGGTWRPLFYDLVTNIQNTTILPVLPTSNGFLRVAVTTDVSEPGLLIHLPFDNDLNDGMILDISGHGKHGWRFGRPCCPTNNWPCAIQGADGGRAAEFSWSYDGWGEFGKSGDYAGVTNVTELTNLVEATIMCWARYYAATNANWHSDQNATLISVGYAKRGAWELGRNYSAQTFFAVATNASAKDISIRFPDQAAATAGDTGDWHHYAVTFSNGLTYAYFDGVLCDSGTINVDHLTTGNYAWVDPWLGLGCATHGGTPALEDEPGTDYPNNGWLNGALDDVRIYNRALSSNDVRNTFQETGRRWPLPAPETTCTITGKQ